MAGIKRTPLGKRHRHNGKRVRECCCEEGTCIKLCDCCYSEDVTVSFTLPQIVNVEGTQWASYPAGQQQAMLDFIAWYNTNIAGTTLVTGQLGVGGASWSGYGSYADMTSVDQYGVAADFTMSGIWTVTCKWNVYVRFSAYIDSVNDYNIEFNLALGTANCCRATSVVSLTNINYSPEVAAAASPTAGLQVNGNKCCVDGEGNCTHTGAETCGESGDGECMP